MPYRNDKLNELEREIGERERERMDEFSKKLIRIFFEQVSFSDQKSREEVIKRIGTEAAPVIINAAYPSSNYEITILESILKDLDEQLTNSESNSSSRYLETSYNQKLFYEKQLDEIQAKFEERLKEKIKEVRAEKKTAQEAGKKLGKIIKERKFLERKLTETEER